MGKEKTNAQLLKKAVDNLINMNADDRTQRTVYLGFIAQSMASIADSLEKMSDHITADPFEKALNEYRKTQEEE